MLKKGTHLGGKPRASYLKKNVSFDRKERLFQRETVNEKRRYIFKECSQTFHLHIFSIVYILQYD